MKKVHAVLLLIVLTGSACSTMNINVPAIGGAADGEHLPGKIIWHELLTDDPEATQRFYNGLFGWEFESLPDARVNYRLIRHRGKPIGGMIDHTRLPTEADISQWVVLLAVTDIDAATEVVKEEGGTVFTPPTSLGDRGMIAIVADPQGGLFALLQTRDGDPADATGFPDAGEFLWDEFWAAEIGGATEFYRKLAPYQLEEKSLGTKEVSVEYNILRSNGRGRVAIRENPIEGLPPIWVSYLRVSDADELDNILAKVESLGGEILMPAFARPGGGTVAIIAGPSGAGIALQTWADDQKMIESGAQQP